MDTTIDNLPAGIVVKEINNDFRYIYRNRESYNRNLCIGESIGKNDFDYYPEVAEKKREEDTLVATTGRGLHWTTEGKDKNGNEIILDKRKIRVDGDELPPPSSSASNGTSRSWKKSNGNFRHPKRKPKCRTN